MEEQDNERQVIQENHDYEDNEQLQQEDWDYEDNEQPQQEENDFLDDKIIGQEMWFMCYTKLPIAFSIIVIIISIIIGIAISGRYILIGFSAAIFGYFICKIILSQKILPVLYLKQIKESICKKSQNDNNDQI